MKKLLSFTAALLMLLGTQTALADHRDRWDRGDSHYDRHDNGRGWNNGWNNNRRDNRGWNRRDHDNVSVSLSFGNVWSDYRYRDWNRATSGFGVAYTTAWGAPYDTWGYNSRPIIVHQNTYVSEPRTRVVTRTPTSRTSLFRDISGRCFEREIDRNDNESRVELPASECDF
jgi:hypothetical protein